MPCANAHAARARSGSPPHASTSGAAALGFDSLGQPIAVERSVGHQPIEVRVLERPGAVGARPRAVSGSRRAGDGIREGCGLLLERRGDDRGFEVGLVGDVLVDRRRPDAELVGDALAS